MSRIPTHALREGDLHRIALLARAEKFDPFKAMLEATRKDVVDKLSKTVDVELHRNQGVYQFLDDLEEIFKKGLDWEK